MRAKLRLDFECQVVLRAGMDDHEELASRLLTLAGVIMEDASAVAIIGEGGIPLAERAAAVFSAAADAELLARAAAIALRRG